MPVMPREDNLLDSTGRDWFRNRVIGGYMLYENKVCRLEDVVDRGRIQATCVENGENLYINKKVITGFAVMSYPQLGYRRVQNNLAGWYEKVGGYMRGMRPNAVKFAFSPASEIIRQRFELPAEARNQDTHMIAVLKPQYDRAQDLDLLIGGDKMQVVLSHDVLIEPGVAQADEDYVVYFRQRACARLNERKEFKWYSEKFKNAVLPILGNYGVHR